MYIIEDRVTPTIQSFMSLLRTKNIILRDWPVKWVDSNGQEVAEGTPGATKVFDRLYFYANGAIVDTDVHKRLYKLLNISIEELGKEDYNGVDSAWFYFEGVPDEIIVDTADLQIFVNNNTDYIEGGDNPWITIEDISYDPIDTNAPPYTSDANIINRVKSSIVDIYYSYSEEHICTALALLDTNNDVFETEYKVTYKNIGPRYGYYDESGSNYILQANIEFRFRRKIDAADPSTQTYFDKVKTHIESIDGFNNSPTDVDGSYGSSIVTTADASISRELSVNAQLINIFASINPIVDTDVVFSVTTDLGLYNSKTNTYVKYDGMAALTAKEFSRLLAIFISSDYKKKKVSGWKKFLAFLVIVIVIFVAPEFIGAALGISSFAISFTITLVLGQLTLTLLAKYLASKGDYAFAAFISGTIQILGMLSTFLNILNVLQAWQSKITTMLTNSMQAMQTGIGSFVENLFDEAVKLAVDYTRQATSSITNFINALTDAFNMYAKYIDPPQTNFSEEQKIIDEQKKEMEDYATPDNLKKVRWLFDSPYANIYDMNEYMQNIPYLMTQGKIDNATKKYYS